ncbi:MAG TPA: TolC family protein [Elusimicrobiota bacterium]|nr:TolC family protein [Elusimicrobiota bacterium]
MKRLRRFLFAVAASCIAAPNVRAAHELTLAEVMGQAEQNSPRLKAARLQEKAAHEGVGAAEAAYSPSIAAEGLDSWGFPGSSGALGIGGLMGSSYRSGAAAGLLATDTLFDFGRTYFNVKTAEQLEELQRVGFQVDRYAVDLDVLRTFYACSRFRSEHEVWDGLHGEIELVAQEVVKYVGTGQRSVVDKYLAQAQVEEARTNRNYFKSRMNSTVARLELLTGRAEAGLSCPALPAGGETVPVYPTGAANPYVRRSEAEVELAKSRLSERKSDYLPKIVGVASVGTMERVRLVNRADYSGGLGVILPLFDGLGTVRRVGEARAALDAKTQELGAVRLQMDETNARYDEIIDASKARIEHLEREQKLAEEGFSVAKNRYFKFQGTLVDLRDALRNIGRIETDLRDTQANLLEAEGSKALLNGGSAVKPAEGKL